MTAPWCPRCGDHHEPLGLRDMPPALLIWLVCGVAIGLLIWVIA